MKHVMIKRVDNFLSERAHSRINIKDFKSAVEASGQVEWKVKEGFQVLNPDGTKLQSGSQEGFIFTDNKNMFFKCYEYYDGIVIQTNGFDRAINLIKSVAKILDATIEIM